MGHLYSYNLYVVEIVAGGTIDIGGTLTAEDRNNAVIGNSAFSGPVKTIKH